MLNSYGEILDEFKAAEHEKRETRREMHGWWYKIYTDDHTAMATNPGGLATATKYPTPYHGLTDTWPPGKVVGERQTSCDFGIELEWDGHHWGTKTSKAPAVLSNSVGTAMSIPTYVGTIDTWPGPPHHKDGDRAISRDSGVEYTWSGKSWISSGLYNRIKAEAAGPTGTIPLQLEPEEFKAFQHYCTKEGTTMQETLHSLLEDLLSRARINPEDYKLE